MSFWGAFVIANYDLWKRKLVWIIGGWLAIWCINVIRMALLIIAMNKNWQYHWD